MSRFPEPIPSVIHTGYVAVGVFFLLSGFVLSYNYSLQEAWSVEFWRRFAIARFARIYPAYCVGLILSAPWVAAYLAQHFSSMTILKESLKAALAWTLLQAWIPQAANAWNNPGWSLSVEASCYLCFPIVGVCLWRLSRAPGLATSALLLWFGSLLAPLVAIMVPLADVSGVSAGLWTRDSTGLWVNFLKYSPMFHLPQFCIGIVLGRVYRLLQERKSRLFGSGHYLYLPAITLEVLALMQYRSTLYVFLHNGLLLPLHSLVILGLALDGGLVARVLSWRPMVLLGNASYSMYLFHGVIADWILLIGKRVLSRQLQGFNISILYIGFLIGFSICVFKLIEEPANRYLKNFFAQRVAADTQRLPSVVSA